jgi:hypothetical protein
LAEALASFFVFDFAADADALEAGHEYEVAAGDGDIGGESGAFVADAFLDDLDEDFAAALEDFLDWGFVASIAFVEVTRGASTASGFVVVIVVVVVVVFGLILNEMSVVLVFDIADMQESVAADAEIDEGSLNAGFDVDNFTFVDVSDVVFCTAAFYVELFEDAVFDDRNPTFLGLQDIYEHFLFHDEPV